MLEYLELMLKQKPRTPLKWKKKKNCQWTGCRLFSVLSTLSEHQHERRNNLQCGNAPRLAIFPRQETRKVLHLVNSSSIFLNFSSLKEKNNNKKTLQSDVYGFETQGSLSALLKNVDAHHNNQLLSIKTTIDSKSWEFSLLDVLGSIIPICLEH